MSSKKSKKLGMHIWEPQDKFVREEFNENTEKIDAAVEKLEEEIRMVKLLDTTLAAGTSRWVIDVSGIDFTQYMRLELAVDTVDEQELHGQVNGITDTIYRVCAGNHYNSKTDYLFRVQGQRSYSYLLRFLQPVCNSEVTMMVAEGSLVQSTSSSSAYYYEQGYRAPVTWENLNTLEIIQTTPNSTTFGTVPAGTRVILTGIKK